MKLPISEEKSFGKKVRVARLKKGLTQLELSKKVKVSRETIANIEGGQQRTMLWTAFKLRRVLGVRL